MVNEQLIAKHRIHVTDVAVLCLYEILAFIIMYFIYLKFAVLNEEEYHLGEVEDGVKAVI